jgi:hypothetical protein
MKRALPLCFLLLGCCVFYAQPAGAQFWKRLFGREEKRSVRKPANHPPAVDKKTSIAPPKKRGAEPSRLPPTLRKPRYRVDVLAPLYLGELVNGGKLVYKSHLPDKVLPGLSFYQGIQLAADTLSGQGYHIDVYLHDITDPKENVDALLKGNKLDTADLIVGAVSAQQVGPLAALAKKRNINFISALTPVDGGVRGNFYFSLIQPTLQRHCEALRAAVRKMVHPTTNLLMYCRNNVAVDMQCFRYLTKDSAFPYTRVLVNTPLPTEKLRNFFDSNVTNVIVMPIVDGSYATQLLEQLGKSFPAYRFEVYGMPSWKGLPVVHKEGSVPNVGITIPSAFYFDPTNSAGKGFSDAFNEKYGGRPAELAYRGYEIMYWYAYLLQRYGTIFNDHYADNGVAPFTRFDMKLVRDSKDDTPLYYENQHVYLYRYQGGSFSIEQ